MSYSRITSLLKTLFVSYFFTVLALLAAAFAMYKLNLKQDQMETVIVLLYLLSCFLGGFLTGKTMKNRRLLWGLAFGLVYFLILIGVSFLIRHALYKTAGEILRVLAFCAAGGALGGVAS